MLDILYNVFSTIIHSIETILDIMLKIPGYIIHVTDILAWLPPFILFPLSIALLASVLIAIKRLIL